MKKFLIPVFVLFISFTFALFSAGESGYFSVYATQDGDSLALNEERLIKKTVEDFYIKGIEIRDFELIKKICIPEAALMSAGRDGTLHLTSLDKWSKKFDPHNPPFRELDHCITKIDREGTAAQVKILFVVDSKRIVTDFLHMLKLEDTWRIVNIIDY